MLVGAYHIGTVIGTIITAVLGYPSPVESAIPLGVEGASMYVPCLGRSGGTALDP